MNTTIIFLCIIAVILVVLLYVFKYWFKNNTRVRYIEIYENEEKYMSYDAFWQRVHLRRGVTPTWWGMVPIVPERVSIPNVTFNAHGRFKNRCLKINTKKPIRSINQVNPRYHMSINAHINIRLDSGKIGEKIEHTENTAFLEYGKNYIMILEDGKGYALKVRI